MSAHAIVETLGRCAVLTTVPKSADRVMGAYTDHSEVGPSELRFRTRVLGSPKDPDRLACPPLADAAFLVRPDQARSSMSRRAWERLTAMEPVSFPTYDELLADPDFEATAGVKWVSLYLSSQCFVWPLRNDGRFAFDFWLDDARDDEAPILGRDFLQHGVLAWEIDRTYFFPRAEVVGWPRLSPLAAVRRTAPAAQAGTAPPAVQ